MVHGFKLHSKKLLVVQSTLLLFLLWSPFFMMTRTFAGVPKPSGRQATTSHTVTMALSNAALVNPGQGWVLYGYPKDQSAQTLAYGRVGYDRYNWSDIEPQEGVYNWSVIDSALNEWRAVGKQFAFGVMNANSSTSRVAYVTPKWVFDDGARFIKSWTYDNILKVRGIQYIPVWNDSIFMQKVQQFVDALAKRYDDNPNISYIDIRSYGNWGVQDVNGLPHSVLLSSKEVQTYIQVYASAFKHTQLIVPWGSPLYKSTYAWAASKNIGLRRDGLMVDSDGSELAPAAGKAPIVFEFYSGYQWLKQKGLWNDSKLITSVHVGEASYVNLGEWGNDARVFLAEKKPLIDTVTNLIGFRITVNSVTIPNTIPNGKASTISFTWEDRGGGRAYQPMSIAVALLDTKNQVVQKQWLPGIKPRNWKPGKPVLTSTPVTFTGVRAGTYKLAVGFFVHTSENEPTYRLGNNGRTSNDWYVISSKEPVS